MRRTAAQTREHVLEIAHDLFYRYGIKATGVDKIAAEAGIAPTTLYRLFPSKDDLVAAYVERAGLAYRQWVDEAVGADGLDPRGRVLALFDALFVQVGAEDCRGCVFLMALAELPDRDLPAHRSATAVKEWMRGRLRELTREMAAVTPIRDPAALADQLALIVEGVYASVQALGVDGPARQARGLVEILLGREG
ncbi:TetR/AcrR family transcriptional regulator [Microbispora sp. NPDC049125]|uniref:TetR/AcrR family transcriptional regulator n=1 Tax=Microbispora sp. NPDC049125 TaxID=3154929 RepID=UPI00346634FD